MRSTTSDIVVFPLSRLNGTARRLLDLAETKTNAEMNAVWERLMDDLEAQMIRCGVGLEERAWQLHDLHDLIWSESHRRAYEGRSREPIEAA